MARERKRVLGELAGVQMAHFSRVMTGEKIDPDKLNPYSERPVERAKTPAEQERESRMAWALLDRFFAGN